MFVTHLRALRIRLVSIATHQWGKNPKLSREKKPRNTQIRYSDNFDEQKKGL